MADTTIPTTFEADETLDTSGLLCPLPVYKAGVVLNRLNPGGVLHLITTDPGSLEDVPALARQRGDELLGLENLGATQLFWIKKGVTR
ncbi:MAG: sulfurtransferase TusA family protein [Actinomycetota bacterium]